jgi:hypothetical protein
LYLGVTTGIIWGGNDERELFSLIIFRLKLTVLREWVRRDGKSRFNKDLESIFACSETPSLSRGGGSKLVERR